MNSSPPTGGFTPINPNGLLVFVTRDIQSSQADFSSQYQDTNARHILTTVQAPGPATPQRPLKRAASSDAFANDNKRQLRLPTTPSSGPFQTLGVTKFGLTANFPVAPNQYGPEYYFTQVTMDGKLANAGHLWQETTMERLTPRSIEGIQDHEARLTAAKSSHNSDQTRLSEMNYEWAVAKSNRNSAVADSGNTLDARLVDQFTTLNDQVASQESHDFDAYPLEDLEEQDMIRLMEVTNVGLEDRIPPSSLVDRWDRDSRSADEYDPNLQYSSCHASSDLDHAPHRIPIQAAQEDLLDDDVDWNVVHAITSSIPKDPSLAGSREAASPRIIQPDPTKNNETSDDPLHSLDLNGPLSPFTRPAFPDKARDRSPVPGLTSSTVLRTVFRIGELMNQAHRCHQHHQAAVFELYARVTYSSRESLARKQHFQFIDLFKDQQPYPSGTLTGWRVGGLLDRRSRVFITTKDPKLCWCLCRPKKDPKVPTGWIFEVMGVRETTWPQIRYAKMILCGTSSEENEPTMTAPKCEESNASRSESLARTLRPNTLAVANR
ncbi:hypothetical protein BJ170DRAFT_170504 [Xylariales sp. AK1849]|nr:hypothetical protein BJ170DRAFT_170504 [Xylariales sp. AK1849]